MIAASVVAVGVFAAGTVADGMLNVDYGAYVVIIEILFVPAVPVIFCLPGQITGTEILIKNKCLQWYFVVVPVYR